MTLEKEFVIQNKMGMHARPAAQFVKRASQYKCDIWVEKDEEPVNGKSIMGLMMLAAGRGETIKITTAGELDKWMDQYCDASKCRDAGARSELKAYQLKSANKWSKACLLEGDTIEVKQRKGEVTDADGALWYLRCEGRQLGVPVRARYDKETDRVWFLQLGF